MAAVYEDNFGHYDLEADPTKRRFSPSSRARASRASACAAQSRSVAAGAQDLRAMLRRDGIRRPAK